jgi:heme A synthase
MATTVAGTTGGKSGWSAGIRSAFTLRNWTLATIIATYVLIVVGGTVRATDSGTACPDWPMCHGQIIPPAETKVWIEFTHRLVASIIGLMILGVVIGVWRTRKTDRTLRMAGVLVLAVLALQVIVGGITVGTETAAGVVAVHLAIALTLFTGLIFVYARLGRDERAATHKLEVLPLLTAAAVFALIITGVFVSQMEAGLAYPDWPLFDGALTPSSSDIGQIHYGHRIAAGLTGVLLLVLFALASQRRAWRPAITGLAVVFVLYVTQVLLGAANVWFDLATWVTVAHLALASAVWAVLVFTMAWTYQNGHALTRES